MTVLSCNCNGERACLMHAEELYDRDSGEGERITRILSDMTAEVHGNSDMAHALLTLYPDNAFTPSDLDAMRKQDAKFCECYTCAEDQAWGEL